MSGAIPEPLGRLGKLESLRLSHNQLTSSIPAALVRLSSLEELDLSDNRLTGDIPAGLWTRQRLRSLDLSRNQLSGTIPAELGFSDHLTDLDLSENRLTGTIPAGLGFLPLLRTLRLHANQLTGELPPTLAALPVPLRLPGRQPRSDRLCASGALVGVAGPRGRQSLAARMRAAALRERCRGGRRSGQPRPRRRLLHPARGAGHTRGPLRPLNWDAATPITEWEGRHRQWAAGAHDDTESARPRASAGVAGTAVSRAASRRSWAVCPHCSLCGLTATVLSARFRWNWAHCSTWRSCGCMTASCRAQSRHRWRS